MSLGFKRLISATQA